MVCSSGVKLSRDVFVALAAIVWADGVVTREESEALLQAARATGLSGADLDAVTASTTTPVSLDQVGQLELRSEEREFVYAVALWLAGADRVVVESERVALARLGDLLGLSQAVRERAALVARALVQLSSDAPKPGVQQLAKQIARSAVEGSEPTFQG
jgi:uncharacterized membrane protein YebE (DUF533 family)